MGTISAFAPRFREEFHLTATQTAFAVGQFFALLMIVIAAPAYIVPTVPNSRTLLYVALFLGADGSSFAVGTGFVSQWFPPERQGGALGIYGLGNSGQSAAVFRTEFAVGLRLCIEKWRRRHFPNTASSPTTVRT
jgi:NNP family nitrate/nitrite transporter-like MFS transporter